MWRRPAASLAIFVCVPLCACAVSTARFVERTYSPRGGIVAYDDYRPDALEAMRDFCGRHGYAIIAEGGPGGGVMGRSAAVGRLRHDWIQFECRDKNE